MTIPFLQACYNDSEEALYGKNECETGTVSFSADVVPIVEQSCYSCHSATSYKQAGAGINLEGYDQLLHSVTDGSLSESINHTINVSPMPKGESKLPDCEISVIDTWIEQGSLNN